MLDGLYLVVVANVRGSDELLLDYFGSRILLLFFLYRSLFVDVLLSSGRKLLLVIFLLRVSVTGEVGAVGERVCELVSVLLFHEGVLRVVGVVGNILGDELENLLLLVLLHLLHSKICGLGFGSLVLSVEDVYRLSDVRDDVLLLSNGFVGGDS